MKDLKKNFISKSKVRMSKLSEILNKKKKNKNLRRRGKILNIFNLPNKLELFNFNKKRKEEMEINKKAIHYDLYLLFYFMKKKIFKRIGINFSETVFCDENYLIRKISFSKKKNEILNLNLKKKEFLIKDIFRKIFQDPQKKFLFKYINEEIKIFNRFNINLEKDLENVNFVQMINYKIINKEFIYFDQKKFKFKYKKISEFTKKLVLNQKYKRPENSIDYISLEIEKKFIFENILNKNIFLIFICFKIYHYIKLFFLVKIEKFSIEIFLNPKDFKKNAFLSDFKIFFFHNYEKKLKKFKVEELMSKKKEDKNNLEILKMKFDNILKNYTYKFLKNSKYPNFENIEWNNNPKKLLKKNYRIIYKNLKNNNKDNLDIKKKIDHSLKNYFIKKSKSSKNSKKNLNKYSKSLLLFNKENFNKKNFCNNSKDFFENIFVSCKKPFSIRRIKTLTVSNRKIVNIVFKEGKNKKSDLMYTRIIDKYYK